LRLESGRGAGARVVRTQYDDDEQEVQGVAARIARLVAQGVSASDIAVLTRINAQQQHVCTTLRAQGLRFRVRRDAGWQSSPLADETQEQAALLEAKGIVKDSSAVTVSTIHASKGLEFPHVFIVGCSEGLLPYGSPAPGEALEEERRLMYVGVTRAKDTLHLSFAARQSSDTGARRRPSRFLV
jgi:DNA helicase-2/ATP-dependent DNA helicase PcrA